MVLISSPATEAGVVYQIHKNHYGPAGDPLILVVESDSRSLNPKLDQARWVTAWARRASNDVTRTDKKSSVVGSGRTLRGYERSDRAG